MKNKNIGKIGLVFTIFMVFFAIFILSRGIIYLYHGKPFGFFFVILGVLNLYQLTKNLKSYGIFKD